MAILENFGHIAPFIIMNMSKNYLFSSLGLGVTLSQSGRDTFDKFIVYKILVSKGWSMVFVELQNTAFSLIISLILLS